jgi:hypothetical protein
MRLGIACRIVLMRASGAIALSLLSATVVFATPAARWHGNAHRACSQKATYVRKAPRHLTSLGGPLARRSAPAVAGLTDLTALLKRGLRANLPGDDEAIQNDAPAARIEFDARPIPALLPLGVLHGSFDRRLDTHTFSPRSPRGPPTSASPFVQ